MVKAAKFLIGMGSLICGFAVAPLSARAADQQPLQGNVSTSTVDVRVSPRALLNLPTGLLSGLPAGVGSTLNGVLDQLVIKLDAANADGILTDARNDLDSGHAKSQAVSINIKGLDELLSNLTSAIGTLNQLTSVVPSLAPQVGPVVAQLTAPINGLIQQLSGASLDKTVSAVLPHGGSGSSNGSNVIDNLSLPGGLNLTLAPFAATATNAASLPQLKVPGVTGPESEAHSTTEALNIGQSLGLPDLTSLNGLLDTVQALVTSLTGVVNQVASTTVGPTAAGILTNPALPAPVLGITTPLANQLNSGTPLAPVDATLANTLNTLKGLVGTLQGLLNINGLSLNKLVQADGITTSSLLQPASNAVHGLATSKFADVKLLQVVGDQLSGLLHTPLGTPLLEVTGAQSSAEASVDGTDTSAPTGSSKLGAIKVLGQPVIDLNSVIPPGTSKTIPVDVGAFALTLQVTAGVPQVTNSSATHKSVEVGALEVSLLNGRPDGSGQIPLLGGGGIGLASTGVLSHARTVATGGNAIVKASFASSAVDVAAGPVGTTTTNASNPQAQGELPKTGKLGPFALAAGALLLAAGLGLRFIPGAVGRLRRSR